MDEEVLRKRIVDEFQAQFDTKLKQMRRLKDQAEEELESSSEKWRAERRRLNSEIDRLEAALVDAKESPRKRGGAEPKIQGVDPAEVARMQAAGDEKFRKANAAWEEERNKLKSQINRLEGAVADAIARSNNPMRAAQSVRDQLESRVEDLSKQNTALEQTFLRSKTEWEQEKLALTGELTKLKQMSQIMGKTSAKESIGNSPKVEELEKRLQDSLNKWNSERAQLLSKIQGLEEAAVRSDNERRQVNEHAGQLKQAFMTAQAKIENYEAVAESNQHYENKLMEAARLKESIETSFQAFRTERDAERGQFQAEIDRLEQQLRRTSEHSERVSNEIVDQLRKQYEQKLQDAIHQKTQLAQQLQSASTTLESERARLMEEIAKSKAAPSNDEARTGDLNTDFINAEVTRVEKMIHEIVTLIDDPSTELSTVIRKNVEKAELDAYLKGILFSVGRILDRS